MMSTKDLGGLGFSSIRELMELLSSFFLYTTATAIIIFFFFFVHLPTHSTSQDTNSYYYSTCAPYACGDVEVAFPFFSSEAFCGLPGFIIACDRSSATIALSRRPYQLKRIVYNDSLITVSDNQLARQFRSNSCDDDLRDHFLPAASFAPLQLFYWIVHLNFSWCRGDQDRPLSFTSVAVEYGGCRGKGESLYLLPPFGSLDNNTVLPATCFHATVPVLQANLLKANFTPANVVTANSMQWDMMADVMDGGFALGWEKSDNNVMACQNCQAAGGRCGYNQSNRSPLCFCEEICGRDGKLGKSSSKFSSWKIILAAVVPTTFLLLAGLVAFIKFKKKGSSFFHNLGNRSMGLSGNSNIKEFISNYKSTLPTEYSYADLRKITDGFKEKLGRGGYGNVYKGKLPNGLPVAAKVLERSKDNGQDFVNEVATIGRIHHVNIIRLLGFCCDGLRRALIYEFMARGSLADLISKEEMRHTLGAQGLLDTALGITRGIEYLHNGCEKRILHLDIKPQNVLLDSNFHPKISDFGLAKSYSRKESVVTLTGARGTAGYIAPEVFMRSLGGVSHKSDVYSFGMLLLEMAMGKKDVMAESEQSSSERYFPDSIYDQLQEWEAMHVDAVVVEEGVGVLRKLVLVGLWCIQTDPVSRPSIGRALEMLRGEVECIDMPPKPLLFALPPKQQMEESLAYSDHGTQASH